MTEAITADFHETPIVISQSVFTGGSICQPMFPFQSQATAIMTSFELCQSVELASR